MAGYKWRAFRDDFDRVCYEVPGRGARVITLAEGRFEISVAGKKEMSYGARENALRLAAEMLDETAA